MSSFIRSVLTGACVLVSVFTLSAATNLATDGASKRTITMVQGKVVGGSLGNAFNGVDGWAAAYGLFSASTEGNVAPSEETPVVFDFTFNDDYRPGEDLGVTRFTVSGINNYYNGNNNTPNYNSSVPSDFTISGSLDGETWTELVSSTGYTAPTHLVIPYAKRAPYRRFRFTFTKNAGYSGTDHGTLFIQNIAIYADSVYYAKVDGSDANDGLSWATATSLTNAFAKANAAVYNELHLQAGTYLPSKCLTATKMMTIVGGLAGEGDEPDAVTGRSVIDAQGAYGTIFSNSTSPGNYSYGSFTQLENLDLRHATAQAVSYATIYGSFRAINCRFAGNRGYRSGSSGIHEGGRGLSFSGYNGSGANNMRCELYDCEFVDNGPLAGSDLTLKWSGCGCSISYGTAVLENCLFASNGLASADMPTSSGTEGMTGHAISSSAKLLATGCRFVRNRGTTGWNNKWPGAAGGATVYATASGNVFDRCLFVANEDVYGGSQRGTLGTLTVTANTVVRNCTFAYNLVDGGAAAGGLTVNGGTAAVTNSIFYGNAVGSGATVGADIHVAAGAALKIGHSLVSSAASLTSADATQVDASDGVVYDNPRFVTYGETAAACRASSGYLRYDPAQEAAVANFDVHLMTPAGYRKNGDEAWYTESDFTSPAIDAGEGDYDQEPAPNGDVRNLGFYGNTEEASKTAEKPHFTIVTIPNQFYDGVNPCRPVPTVRDLDSGLVLSAETVAQLFSISYRNNESYGTGQLTLTGNNGNPYTGQSLTVEFVISALFRVANDATDEGTGMSWESPMTLEAALTAATRPTDVIQMKAGTYPLAASVVVASPVTIRGGYAGTDDETLADDPESVLDGQDTLVAAVLSVTANASANDLVTVERLALVRSQKRGLLKTGAASLLMRNCRIEHNRYAGSENIVGIGASVSGTAGATTVRLVDCRVADNCDTVGGWKDCRGHGMAFSDLKEVQLIGCAFVSNGIPLSAGYGTTYSFSYQQRGFAVYATSVPIVASNCEFRANRGLSASANGSNKNHQFGGIISLDGNGHGTSFSHCLFAGNQSICPGGDYVAGPYDGTVYVDFDTAARTAAFDFCTFLANLSDGLGSSAALNLRKGAFTLSNSVFAHNVVGTYAGVGADVHLAAGTLEVSYTIFGGKGEGWVSAAAEGATISGLDRLDVLYGDALTVSTGDEVLSLLAGAEEKAFPRSASPVCFVNSSAADVAKFVGLDAHLLSAGGYRRNGDSTWHEDVLVMSPGVDAADPEAPWSDEPTPNGGCANMGCYGGTSEATKTATGEVGLPEEIVVTYPDGYSRPCIAFTLGGSGSYSATVTVSVRTNGSEVVYEQVLVGQARGSEIKVTVPDYFVTGDELQVTVNAQAFGKDTARTYPEPVSAPEPPWIGKKGPANVIHVRAGALGKKDGTSWTDAYDDLVTALGAVTAERDEIWFAGRQVFLTDYAKISVTRPVVVRGGFAGCETTHAERPAGTLSTLDGNHKTSPLKVGNGAEMYVERVAFVNGYGLGVDKSGSGNLTLEGCRIEGNGWSLNASDGYGAKFEGSAGTTTVALRDCTFGGNGVAPYDSSYYSAVHDLGSGFGCYLKNLKRITFDNCLFVTNGMPFTQPANNYKGWRSMSASAVYATQALVTMRGCRFVCNRSLSTGGTVRLCAGTGGSAFTNCLFVGNQDNVISGGAAGSNGGALRIEGASADDRYDVVNCTFTANLADCARGGGALSVRGGTANVKNCIFDGNLVGAQCTTNGVRDLFVASGAAAHVSYSLLSATNALLAADGGTLTRGAGIKFGAANFVSNVEKFKNYVQRVSVWVGGEIGSVYGSYFLLNSLDDFLAVNCHLRGPMGYVDEMSGREVLQYRSPRSPGLDGGDPQSPYRLEPDRGVSGNGRRANMGFYGNTPWATRSRLSGFVIRIDGGGSGGFSPAPVDPQPPVTAKYDDIVVCDQLDQSIKIYDGNRAMTESGALLWKWTPDVDPDAGVRAKATAFKGNVAECKPVNGGRQILMTSNGGCWAILERATTNVVAWGMCDGYPHSAEILPGNIVAVASTGSASSIYLFYFGGAAAMNGPGQCRTKIDFTDPHGAQYVASEDRVYVADTVGLHRCRVTFDGTAFAMETEKTWPISVFKCTYGHDLRSVPGTTLLSMTTSEKILFFDLAAGDWAPISTFITCADPKAYDTSSAGHRLVTIPKTEWWTDELDLYRDGSMKLYQILPGAKFYKARWIPR